MWSMFPELLGPMIGAYVAGSLVAWLLVVVLLPRRPSPEVPEPTSGLGGS